MNKHSLPPLNNKRSKSTIFIPLIVIIISFHLILLYIYINRKGDKEQSSDKTVSLTKVENESYSDTPVQNQLIEPVELELSEDSNDIENSSDDRADDSEHSEDGSLPALMSKNDIQVEGNPQYQTLFPSYQAPSNTEQEQNIAPITSENPPLENIQTTTNKRVQEQQHIDNQAEKIANTRPKQAKVVKKHHRPKREPIFDEPMYPPVYPEPEPQATEQDIKDSALLSADLPQVQRPQLVPINKKAKEKLQQMEQAKAKNDKLQEQLSSSIQNVRTLNARKIEQEKQLARRAYEDSLALQQLKNQTRQNKKKQVQKVEITEPVKTEPKKTPKVETKTTAKVATKKTPKIEPKKVAKVQPKQTKKAEVKKVQTKKAPKAKTEPKKAVQPQKKAPVKTPAKPKVKEVKKTAEPKKQDKKEQS